MINIKVPNTKVTKATTYKEAGEARYVEAKSLRSKHPSGAIYLAGYLVECYLKWAFCKRNGISYLQDLSDKNLVEKLTSGKGHDLELLSLETGYKVHLVKRTIVIRRAFQIVAAWSPNIRYVKICGKSRQAVQFLAAVEIVKDDIHSWANL